MTARNTAQQSTRRSLRDLHLPDRRAACACALAALLAACDSSGNSGVAITNLDVGKVTADIELIPSGTECVILTVVGGSPAETVTDPFNVTPNTSATFALANLPIGPDTFTAKAYPVPCAQVTAGMTATYSASTTGTVPATLDTASPFSVSLNFGSGSGEGYVVVNFPNPTWSIIETAAPTGLFGPYGITAGPDGNLWFTEYDSSDIGIVTPGTPGAPPLGNFQYDPVPGNSFPTGITAGPDGNVWFVALGNGSTPAYIGRLSPGAPVVSGVSTGDLQQYTAGLPANAGLNQITTGPDGALWFTVNGDIGRITTGGLISIFTGAAGSSPYAIVAGPDGNLWFTDPGLNSIGRLTPGVTGGNIQEYPIPTQGSGPKGIAIGADGNIWFTEITGNNIGRITTLATPSATTISEYPIPTQGSFPWGVTAGPDGNVWFVENAGNAIGVVSTGIAPNPLPLGTVTEYSIPTPNSQPLEITTGPDGNLWFTENQGNKVGTFILY